MKQKRPKVSVVLPVYNGSLYIRSAVESILKQSFTNFEMIIIDDGSVDTTPSILRSLASEDSRISLLRQDHEGYVTALNRGCQTARGDYISRMDADDISLPNRLAMQVKYLDENENTMAVGGALHLVDKNGGSIGLFHLPTSSQAIKQSLNFNCALAHPTVTMRRSAYLRVGGYRPSLIPCEDYDLWLRFSERGELANLEEVVLKYRIHSQQISSRQIEQQVFSFLAAQKSAECRREARSDPIPDTTDRITPDFLESIGIRRSLINRAVLRAYLARSVSLWKYGMQADSIEVLKRMLVWDGSVNERRLRQVLMANALAVLSARPLGRAGSSFALAFAFCLYAPEAAVIIGRAIEKRRPFP